MYKSKTSAAVVDDHRLLRNGLANLIRSRESYAVLFEADNGKNFIEQLKPFCIPDIVLMDFKMQDMDGFETALWLKRNYPGIKVLALSMDDKETSVIRMIQNGARGYILKDIDPVEFRRALDSLASKGYYYLELLSGKLIHTAGSNEECDHHVHCISFLNDRETEFLRLACTEMTYKEIAEKMFLSARTIDGYRDALFEKLNVKSRVGLVIYAIRNGIVSV